MRIIPETVKTTTTKTLQQATLDALEAFYRVGLIDLNTYRSQKALWENK